VQLHLRSSKLPVVKRVRDFGFLFDVTSIDCEIAMSRVPAKSIRRLEPKFSPRNTKGKYHRPTDKQWTSMVTELQELAFVKFKLNVMAY